MLFGAHVSIAGGVFNAPLNALQIGCEVFQMFTRSPQGGPAPKLTPEVVSEFKKNCHIANQKEWVVHAPYFINFASGTPRIAQGSVSVVREELERASLLGAHYLMIHPGSYKDLGQEKGFEQLVLGLAKTLDGYRGSTEFLLEISAGAGDVIGSRFEEISTILNHPRLKKYPIGICFDTQHAFGSGYDLRTPTAVQQTFDTFDNIIGLDKLKMFHCNDSKIDLGGNKDRHEHIGDGKIGLAGFQAILNDKRLVNLNFYVETEHDKVVEDLKILQKIRATV